MNSSIDLQADSEPGLLVLELVQRHRGSDRDVRQRWLVGAVAPAQRKDQRPNQPASSGRR
ncbi:MAG: hypothetical protein OXC81_03560 [Betaproteobacteria bacterium]|nr:hypothetical protein [Betaproteobacteria bacterium]